MLKIKFLNSDLNLFKFKFKFFLLFLLIFSIDSLSDTKLIILGSGTPNPDPERYGSGYAIVVNDSAYIIDFGPGIVRRISAMSPTWGGDFSSMELQKINIAFLTHIHSDHSAALADLILTPWIMGRDEPLKLYGPPGLKSMSENITEAYIDDINYRLYGSQPANKLGFTTKVTEISKDGIIYKDDNVEVTAFKNSHGDFENSFGFLFITKDKKILLSGDTGISENLKKYGKSRCSYHDGFLGHWEDDADRLKETQTSLSPFLFEIEHKWKDVLDNLLVLTEEEKNYYFNNWIR